MWRHINDRPSQRQFAFQGSRVLERIVGWNLNAGPVNGERDSQHMYPFLMAQSIGDAIINKKESDMGYIMAVAIANCTAPSVAEESLSQPDARKMFKRNALAFIHTAMTKPRFYATLSEEIITTSIYVAGEQPVHEHLPAEGTFAHIAAPDFLQSTHLTSYVNDPHSLTWICHVLLHLVTNATHAQIKYASSFIYIHTYVAFAKRGMITEAKATKITDQMRLEIDVPLNIDPDVIASIYAALGTLINQNNAQTIFESWAEDMGTLSLRMKITLDQVTGSGLTTYSAIREAMYFFQDFEWGQALGYLPKDKAGFHNALRIISDNMYYGFAQSLNEVGSSKYKSLGYVAKELLVKYGGPEYGSLGKAQCWTRNPLFKAELDELIANYRSGDGQAPAPMDNRAVAALLDDVARTYDDNFRGEDDGSNHSGRGNQDGDNHGPDDDSDNDGADSPGPRGMIPPGSAHHTINDLESVT
nr:nucleoprotein [Chuviridae sp.]